MSRTNSWGFPTIFNVTRNCVNILADNASIVNRSRLLILTNPTEIYNKVDQGVGLKRYLWQYNTANTAAMIQDRIKDQLRKYEPCVDSDKTSFADGLVFSGSDNDATNPQRYNQLKMTVGLSTVYGDDLEVDLNDAQDRVDAGQEFYNSLSGRNM
mgnify:CR=1 FL=1